MKNFVLGANVNVYTNTPTPENTTLYYRVLAFNGAGSSAWSKPVTLVTPGELPQKPAQLTITASTRNTITLHWTDVASNELGFYLERSITMNNLAPALETL